MEIQKTKINPQLISGKVVLANSAETSTVLVLDALSGAQIAKSIMDEPICPPYLIGDSLYIGTVSGKVYSYNISRKNNEWTFQKKGNGILFVTGDSGGVYAVSAHHMMKLLIR